MRVTAAYVTARHGVQRLRKAKRGSRGSGYIRYAARVADGAQWLLNTREVKPTTKQQLITGIQQLWSTDDVEKCRRDIRYLKKVLPKVIKVNGDATGY